MGSFRINLNYHYAIILCVFMAGLSLSMNVRAAAWAIVEADRAEIFSDIQMTSVLGYVKKGKKIRVGTVPKNKGRLLPVIVSNKVAYIQIKDIRTGNVRIDNLNTVVSRIKNKMNVKTHSKRVGLSAGLNFSYFFRNEFEDEFGNNLLFWGYGARGYYRDLRNNEGYKFSLNYMTATKKDTNITYFSIPFGYKFYDKRTKNHTFEVYAGPLLLPFIQFTQGDDFKINGQGIGAEVSAEILFPLSDNLQFHLDGSFQFARYLNIKLPANGLYPELFDPYVSGFKLVGAVTYEY